MNRSLLLCSGGLTMATKTMMSLGDFRFSIDTAAYQKLQRTVEYRWPAQARVGRRPARQFVGIGDDSISLDGVIYPNYRGGLGQVEKMRTLAGKGEPLSMVSGPDETGSGRAMGKWCITRIAETQSVHFSDGSPRKQEFRLQLSHYGEDS